MKPAIKALLRTKSILLIDEDRHSRQLLTDICRALGVGQLMIAKSAADALEMLQTLVFHGVICNWAAAPSDAPALIKRIRTSEHTATRHVPIIVTKQGATRLEVSQARDAGMTEFLAPPLSIEGMAVKLEGIFLKPRIFVEAGSYNGPDRRRRPEQGPDQLRRQSDPHTHSSGLASNQGEEAKSSETGAPSENICLI